MSMRPVRQVYHSIECPEGGNIAACCHLPDDSTRSGVGVVFLHTYFGCKLGPNNLFMYLSEALSQEGILCFRFDYRGCGESVGGGDPSRKSEARDAEVAMEYLCKTYNVRQLVLVPMCFGSRVMFRSGFPPENIHGVIMLSPQPVPIPSSSSFRSILSGFWLRLCGRLRPDTLDQELARGVSSWCKAVRKRRILVLLGASDIDHGHVRDCYESLIKGYSLEASVVSLPDVGLNFPLLATKLEILQHIRAFIGEASQAQLAKD